MKRQEKTISATEARVHFGEVIRRVQEDEILYVEKGGVPKAVILSIDEYRRLLKQDSPKEFDEDPEWLRMVRETGELFQKDLKGRKIDWDQVIDDMREERGAQIIDSLH